MHKPEACGATQSGGAELRPTGVSSLRVSQGLTNHLLKNPMNTLKLAAVLVSNGVVWDPAPVNEAFVEKTLALLTWVPPPELVCTMALVKPLP
jgi:hypothetical protein